AGPPVPGRTLRGRRTDAEEPLVDHHAPVAGSSRSGSPIVDRIEGLGMLDELERLLELRAILEEVGPAIQARSHTTRRSTAVQIVDVEIAHQQHFYVAVGFCLDP